MSQSTFLKMSVLAVGVASAFAWSHAHSAAFQLKENSVKAMGRAFAGAASAEGDSSVVLNNPAMMSTFSGTTVQGDLSLIDVTSEFSGSGTSALGSPLTGSDGGNAGGFAAIPAFSVVHTPFDSAFSYGLMVSAPYGLKTEYDAGWVGRYTALVSSLKTIDLTASISYQMTPEFSIGGGVILEHAEAELSKNIDFGSAICANPQTRGLCQAQPTVYGPQLQDGYVNVAGTDNSIGWVLGMAWQPSDSFTLGFTHRSKIEHELRGEVDFRLPAPIRGVFDQSPVTKPMFTNTPGGAKLNIPTVNTLSMTWQANDQLSLMGELSHTGWSSFEEIRIEFDNPSQADSVEPFEWENAMFYSMGADYKLDSDLTLRAGVAFDETPTNNTHRTPRLPDQDRTWFSVGFSWQANPNLEINGGYTHIMVDDPKINLAAAAPSRETLVGTYDASVNLLGVSAQYRF